MARILITGGAGYVGSHCAKALAAAGHEGIVFDSLLFGHRALVRWGKLIEGDIRDAGALNPVFAAYRIDAVMHFAALAYVGESVNAPDRYYDVNVNCTRILLDAMVRAAVSLIVFSSPCAIYGEPDQMAIGENTPLNPINPYGFTKLVCERMMDDLGRAYGVEVGAVALLQCRRCRPYGRDRRRSRARNASHSVDPRCCCRSEAHSSDIRHRLPNTRWHCNSGLRTCVGSRLRACPRTSVSARRRPEHRCESCERSGRVRAGNHRYGECCYGPCNRRAR